MPNSLRARLKKCVHKGILAEKDIDRLVVLPPRVSLDTSYEKAYKLGYDAAIKALKQEPCEACISRQSAIFLADDLKEDLPDDEHIANMVLAHNEGILEYQTKLSLLPPVTPQPKTGHWNTYKLSQGGIDEEWLECSECMWSNALLIPRNYCPNCGTKMESEE